MMMIKKVLSSILLAYVSLVSVQSLKADYQEQCDQFFQLQSGKPFVAGKIKLDWRERGDFTRHYGQSVVVFAMKSFYLNEDVEQANQELVKLCNYHIERPLTFFEIHSFPSFSQALIRLCKLYGPSGSGQMSDEAYEVIQETMWLWLNEKSELAEAELEKSQTLYVYDSENHHAQHFSTCWGFAMVLKDNDEYKSRKLKDGLTVLDHFQKWSEYISEYLLQRGRKGMLVEIASPSYAPATLKAVYYVYDFADEPVLKRRADNYLKLYWALWAQEQLDGVRGGGKTRSYPASSMRGDDFIRRAAWFYFGIGDKPFIHSIMLCFATSSWRMPEIITELADKSNHQDGYEIIQRRLGLAQEASAEHHLYKLRGDYGGILRYGYCEPGFIMGCLMTEPFENDKWAAISSQNRWQGVIFASDTDARIFPHCEVKGDSSYNAQWAVQSKGTLISQKLKTSVKTGDMLVWFSGAGISDPIKKGGWIFAQAGDVWVAVKIVSGGFSWKTDIKPAANGRWLKCENEYSPVIIEVASKDKFEDFKAFILAVVRLDIEFKNDILRYKSTYGDELVFYADYSSMPKVNGKNVDLKPKQVYDSPFVKSIYDSGIVTMEKGGKVVTLDFN